MVKRIIVVLTAIVFLISFTFCEDIAFAGQAADAKTTAIDADEELAGLLEDLDPAAEPSSCDGFEDLSWGSSLDDLPKAESTEVVFRGVEFAGYYGSAHYIFDAEDHLVRGIYLFNELMSLDWNEALKVYLHIRKYLISEYGLPSEIQRPEGQSSIEEFIAEGSGAWSEMWQDLTSSDEDQITLFATMQGNGMIEIQFVNKTAQQG